MLPQLLDTVMAFIPYSKTTWSKVATIIVYASVYNFFTLIDPVSQQNASIPEIMEVEINCHTKMYNLYYYDPTCK